MRVIKANQARQLEAYKLFSVAFNQPTTAHLDADAFQKRYEEQASSHWQETFLALNDEEQVVSTVTSYAYDMVFDGHTVPMNGIGGVASYPQYRNQGAVRACMKEAFDAMQARGQVFSCLYPFSSAYYRKFGYESCCPTLRFTIPLQNLQETALAGTYHLYEPDDGFDELRAVYEPFAAARNLMLVRDAAALRRYAAFDPYAGDRHLYVYRDASGAPKAYAAFHAVKRDGRMTLEIPRADLAFADGEGLRAILNLAVKFKATYETLTLELNEDFPLDRYVPETVLRYPETTRYFGVMARVIDVRRALELARYQGDGQAVIQVEDAQLARNDAAFSVTFRDGRAVDVEQTQQEADITLPVCDFTALILGRWRFEDYLFSGARANNAETLSRVFYPKPCLVQDFY